MRSAECERGIELRYPMWSMRNVSLPSEVEILGGRFSSVEILSVRPSGSSTSKKSGSQPYTIKTEGK